MQAASFRFWWVWLLIVGLALFGFYCLYGFEVLDIYHTNWLVIPCSDIIVGFTSWEYFAQQPWTWPLGELTRYNYPLTINIGVTDSIPIMAIVSKLFVPLLGEHFQYHGFWFLFSFLLQGFFGYKLLRALGVQNGWHLLFGTGLFLFSPPFLHRFHHPSLACHWLILASFWLYFEDEKRLSANRKMGWQIAFTAFVSAVHPYLAAMLFGFALALFTKLLLVRQTTWKRAGIAFVSLAASVVFVWYAVGYFNVGGENIDRAGFGFYSMNLNALFNSQDKTALLPGLPLATEGQYEGFGYLGLGGLLTVVLALATLFLRKLKWRWSHALWPLLIVTLGCFVYALSDKWTLNAWEFLRMDYPSFITGSLRSSGRFVWPMHYLVLAAAVWAFAKSDFRQSVKMTVLAAALGLQIWDVSPMLSRDHTYVYHDNRYWQYNTVAWHPLVRHAERVITYPPYAENFYQQCDYGKFVHMAAQFNVPITCGRTNFRNEQKKYEFEAYVQEQLSQKNIENEQQSLFITTLKHLDQFIAVLQHDAAFAFVQDGYLLIVPRQLYEQTPEIQQQYQYPMNDKILDHHPESLLEFVQNREDKIILLAAKDDASHKLSYEFRQFMKTKGSGMDTLRLRNAYVGILQNGKLLAEALEKEQPAELQMTAENSSLPVDVSLFSAGFDTGNQAMMLVDGTDVSPNLRGMNVVVLNARGEVEETISYDTFLSTDFNQAYKKWQTARDTVSTEKFVQ